MAVGKRKKQDLGRGLSEINGGFSFVERSRFRPEEMHGSSSSACQQPCDRHLVETFCADDNEAPPTRFSGAPRSVENFSKAVADALHEEPHWLAAHLDQAFYPQDIAG